MIRRHPRATRTYILFPDTTRFRSDSMTPGGRVQAAVGLLDAIIAAARDQGAAADTLIARYFAERRYAGSKDRRAVRDLVYATIRLLGERPESGRQAIVALARADPAVAAMIDGSPHAPPPIDPAEPGSAGRIAQAWLLARLQRSGLAAAHGRAAGRERRGPHG